MAGLFDYLTVGGIANQLSNKRLPTQEELIVAAKVNPYGLIQQGGQAVGDILSRINADSNEYYAGREPYTFSDLNQGLKDRVNQIGKQGGTPVITSEGGAMPPPVFNDLRQGVLSDMTAPQLGRLTDPNFTASGDQYASLGFNKVGQDLMQAPTQELGVDGSTIPARKDGGDISALSIDVNGIPSRKVVTPEAMEDAADVHQRMGTDATTVTPQEAASTAGIAKASMEAQGKSFETQQEAPEGIEKSVWQGFNDQFDLTTIGLTLMATAQNGNDLGVNLGLAMQAGRVAKTASKDKAVAKQEKDDAKARQARADLAAATQQEFENQINAGEFDIKLTAEQRAASGQPLDDANTEAQTKLRQAQAFKIYDEAKKASGLLVPPINATQQAQGVDVLLSAGFNGKAGDPNTNRLGKTYAELAESERLNGFQGDPSAKIIDYMMKNNFFRDQSWWRKGNFASADLGEQLGLN
jgi:hypothetical protein